MLRERVVKKVSKLPNVKRVEISDATYFMINTDLAIAVQDVPYMNDQCIVDISIMGKHSRFGVASSRKEVLKQISKKLGEVSLDLTEKEYEICETARLLGQIDSKMSSKAFYIWNNQAVRIFEILTE